jgi:hypothetical protein
MGGSPSCDAVRNENDSVIRGFADTAADLKHFGAVYDPVKGWDFSNMKPGFRCAAKTQSQLRDLGQKIVMYNAISLDLKNFGAVYDESSESWDFSRMKPGFQCPQKTLSQLQQIGDSAIRAKNAYKDGIPQDQWDDQYYRRQQEWAESGR